MMDNRTKSTDIYLSVIVPAFNEEDRIVKTLREIEEYLDKKPYQHELIVVNDGSTDRTVEVISALSPEYPAIRLLDNSRNMGKGWVVRQGMLNAKGKIRLFMDADNSTTIDQFDNMVPFFEEGYNVVIGSRAVNGAVIATHQSRFRESLGQLFNFIASIISGISIKDTQAGFKAFTSQAAGKIFPLQTIYGWSFDLELLVISKQLGYEIKEIPILWNNDFRSHVKIKHAFNTIFELFKIRYNLWSGRYSRSRGT